MTIRGHFDGKVIVLDEPATLSLNQRVSIVPESHTSSSKFGTLEHILSQLSGQFNKEDLKAMADAIEEACEHVDPEPDVQL